MDELSIDWFELAVKVYNKLMLLSPKWILKDKEKSKSLYIIVFLIMNKNTMRLNLLKINSL